jgi:glutamine---fructose-6-phosphate transaminase (isomerizing)
MYHSHDEIFQQGASLKLTHAAVSAQADVVARMFDEARTGEIVILACGSSYWLSMSACMTIREKTGIRCTAVKSGDVVMNPEFYRKAYEKPLVLAPSRSGNTSETLLAVKMFKEWYGSKVLGVAEYPGAAILALCDAGIRLPWANEASVCQTRSFSNLYFALVLMAAIVGNDSVLRKDLLAYSDEADQLALRAEPRIRKWVDSFPEWTHTVGLGNGKLYGVCVEGVYIGIEMAQMPGNYYGLLEYRHGPIVTAGPHVLAIILSGGNGRDLEGKMASEIRFKGAKVISISDETQLAGTDDGFVMGRSATPEATALFGVMVMQGFAYWKAVGLGIDPDNPKGLVPFITL